VAISFFEKTAAWEPEARISAEQALIHPWITGSSSQMPMTSKDIIKAFKGQAEFNKVNHFYILVN
jgi:calcium/calmodulin-dependent protein kinase I